MVLKVKKVKTQSSLLPTNGGKKRKRRASIDWMSRKMEQHEHWEQAGATLTCRSRWHCLSPLTTWDWHQERRLTGSSWKLLSPCCRPSVVHPKHPKSYTLLLLLFHVWGRVAKVLRQVKILEMDLFLPVHVARNKHLSLLFLLRSFWIWLSYVDLPFHVGWETVKRWINNISFWGEVIFCTHL